MLKLAGKMRDLSFGQLMAVYAESSLERGRELHPLESEARQTALGEEDLYQYLTEVFFRMSGAVCAVWEIDGKAVSALRLEPYRDGMLLTALETAPEHRERGYAKSLVTAVLERYPGVKIYSHVAKRNTPSRRTHEACGFRKILDHAVYSDGSVMQGSFTYCHE